MDLTIRDLMVIAGVLLILGVALDAARRISSERYSRSRPRTAAPGSGYPADEVGDDDELFWPRELPNGPARVVHRGEVNRATEGSSTPAREVGSEQRPARATHAPASDGAKDHQWSDVVAAGSDDEVELVKGVRAVDRDDDTVGSVTEAQQTPEESPQEPGDGGNTGTPASAARGKRGKKPVARSARRKKSEPSIDTGMDAGPADNVAEVTAGTSTPQNIDWLEDMAGEGEPVEADITHQAGRLPRGVEPEIFMLNVVSRSTEGFRGEDILHILLACGLRFGDMEFFHRHELGAGRGPIQFSVANMMQPGVFDLDAMDDFRTTGLVFFVTLPGPDDMMKAFNYMLETAQTVARNLDGDVLDESRSVITRQTLEHSRQRIRDLERRLLARASG